MNVRKVVVSIVLISDSKELLLVKNENSWFLPGGKREIGESNVRCLRRELCEELPGLSAHIIQCFGEFNGLSPNSHRPRRVIVFLGKYLGGSIEPSMEISESKWVSSSDFKDLNISEITLQVILKLQEEGRL